MLGISACPASCAHPHLAPPTIPPLPARLQLLPCTPAMLDGTLGDALSSEPGRHEALPLGTRRVVFLSGMYALEVMEASRSWEGGVAWPLAMCGLIYGPP